MSLCLLFRCSKRLIASRQEGFHAFYKGITPRIMRVAPGQAVTFTVYEFLKDKLENSTMPLVGGKYEGPD